MTKKWLYGDSWEKYPIETGQVWTEQITQSKLQVYDILDGLPDFMLEADMIYSDTPWNTGNITSFYTKAGKVKRCNFGEFSKVVFAHISDIAPKICYLEIGKQNFNLFQFELSRLFPVVQYWHIVYYRKNPCVLLRGGYSEQQFDFTGIDDEITPITAMRNEQFSCVADMCMGRGNTATSAYKLGKQFVGTELNKRRLACAIDKVTQLGGEFAI